MVCAYIQTQTHTHIYTFIPDDDDVDNDATLGTHSIKQTVSARRVTNEFKFALETLNRSENIVQAENNKINKHVSRDGRSICAEEQDAPDDETLSGEDVLPSGQ